MNLLFIILTFLVIITVILLTDLTSAMLVVSLLANFLVINVQTGKISKNMLEIGVDQHKAADDVISTDVGDANPAESNQNDLYGPFYEMWRSYQDSYSMYPKKNILQCPTNNIDATNVLLAQDRARDKKCTDGWVTKDTNYYRYHFGGELDMAEDRIWWGRFDY